MCFTPAISLGTALLEWALAIILLFSFRKSRLRRFGVPVLFLLGLYQFAEFGLCTQGNAEFWGTLAFLAYTFLPVLGLHAALAYLNRHCRRLLLYAPPVVFALIGLARHAFVSIGRCEEVFITLWTFFSFGLPLYLYVTYYAGYIIAMFFLLSIAYRQKAAPRAVTAWLLASLLLMTIPTIILVSIFPALRVRFGSVLCHFAVLTAIAFFIAVYHDAKRKR
jgi:hypothetical protein